ncbi:TPA: non-canonical purine NTP pyrophosphatase [Patescibacteria group bacterium]|uniref:Non-canonical purine NTP pyrophosphatase n=1 Tax=Candidatus Gottesmanbacteria bacterium GW2011_GWA1_43_11 TaxID=1618436 RepID=A0A0G1CDL4_9BACT|nr:MAG: Non-canonical purine NTP pyrophosphatase [Candidatus Gottesmanbacteria bacterium GW2011_GWA1_43_11]HCS78566.1 non-canonical purine NTP pyrophosphatase [Patescibacteria group bacterium]
MQRLLIATSNPGKLRELKLFLSDLPLELIGLKDLHITAKAPETGATFEENAVLKAKFYAQKSGLPALADDGGFEIDALSGEPGVKSHRWADPSTENDDETLINFTLKRLGTTPLAKRGAQLRLVLALVLPSGQSFTTTNIQRGIVPFTASPKREHGFPYRSLLFFPEINKFYIDLTDVEMEQYNHRKRAVAKMKPIIRKNLLFRL